MVYVGEAVPGVGSAVPVVDLGLDGRCLFAVGQCAPLLTEVGAGQPTALSAFAGSGAGPPGRLAGDVGEHRAEPRLDSPVLEPVRLEIGVSREQKAQLDQLASSDSRLSGSTHEGCLVPVSQSTRRYCKSTRGSTERFSISTRSEVSGYKSSSSWRM
jgi:hypothetical protein